MIKLCTGVIAATVLCLWGLGDSRPVAAADLPAATVQMLNKLKLSPDILKGLDQELTMPAAWVGGKTHGVKVSGPRTAITVKGQESDRRGAKSGMTCDITYPGNKEEAKKIACM